MHAYAATCSDLLCLLQQRLWVLLLVVAHIDVPHSPSAIFGSCDHLSRVWGKRQAQYLAFMTLHERDSMKPLLCLDQSNCVFIQACTAFFSRYQPVQTPSQCCCLATKRRKDKSVPLTVVAGSLMSRGSLGLVNSDMPSMPSKVQR